MPPFPRRRTAKRLLLVGGALLLSLAVGEFVLRTFVLTDGRYGGRPLPPLRAINHPGQQALYERRLRAWQAGTSHDGAVLFDTGLGWTFAPSRRSGDGVDNTNALAARGTREYGPTPPQRSSRVLTFGDSFTYCNHVGDDETWQRVLESRDPQLEVINFGVPSYGTDQALLRFRRCGRDLGARVVVMGLMLENIGRNVNRYRPVYFAQSGTLGIKPRFVLDGGDLVLVPIPYRDEGEALRAIGDGSVLDDLAAHEHWRDRPRVPFGDTFATLRLLAGYIGSVQRRPSTLWSAPDEEPYRVTVAILAAFAAEARAAGAEFAPVLVFPPEDALATALGRAPRYWSAMLADLGRHGVAAIDSTDALVAACGDAGASSVFASGHLNARGNAAVADLLFAWLAARL